MSLKLNIEGSRPPSARSQQSVNPITGEKMQYTDRTPRNRVQNIAIVPRPASRPNSRPNEVPALALGVLAYDNDPDKMVKLDPYDYKIGTPHSATTSVSWGTPSSISTQLRQKELQLELILNEQENQNQQRGSARPGSGRAKGGPNGEGVLYKGSARSQRDGRQQQQQQLKQPTAWDKDPCPEDLPPPSAKHKQQYEQYQKEMQESFRQQNLHELDENSVQEKIEQLRLEIPPCALVEEQDEEGDQSQKQWTQQPYSKKTMMKRQDIEELEAEKRKKKLVETVMIDQLSRFVVCDPEQDEFASKKLPNYAPPMKKGSYRKLHDSKLHTSGTSTENLLSRRIQFGARILTRNGRDSLRDLTGFFFALDNSITVYEFRQFGKGAKALPFIKRGQYRIPFGRRKDEHFSIADIMQGNTVSFKTNGQPLPDHLLEEEHLNMRVTEVDDDAKAAVLLSHLDPADREEVWKRAHLPLTQEEMDDRLLLQSVHNIVRSQIKKRGVKVFTNMSKLFRKFDENHDGRLNKYELEKAMYDFRIEIPDEKFDDLWELVDIDGNSFLDYGEFIRNFIGEMSEKRKKLVRKAFLKMDTSKQGVTSIDMIGKFYNAHKHPKVISREMREDQARQQFVLTFQDTETKGQVTYLEFEEYYEGLSVGVEYDKDFENILKNAWGV